MFVIGEEVIATYPDGRSWHGIVAEAPQHSGGTTWSEGVVWAYWKRLLELPTERGHTSCYLDKRYCVSVKPTVVKIIYENSYLKFSSTITPIP